MVLTETNEGFIVYQDGKEILNLCSSFPFVEIGKGKSEIKSFRGNFDFVEQPVFWQKPFEVEKLSNSLIFAFKEACIKAEFDFEDERLIINLSSNLENDSPINRFKINFPCSSNEAVYGLGEQFTYFNLKGHEFPIFSREQGVGRNKQTKITQLCDAEDGSGGDYYTTYYAQPTFVSTDNYFIHVDSFDYMIVDFSKEATNTIKSYSLPKRIILSKKDSLIETAKDVSALLGRQRLLPSWVHDGIILGVQGGTDVVLKRLQQAQEHNVKVAGLWAQDWEGVRYTSFGKRLSWNWVWNQELYPNLDVLIPKLKSRGVHFLGYINPYLLEGKSLCLEAQKGGYLVKKPSGEDYLFDFGEFNCGIVDLFNPEAYKWYKNVIKTNLVDFGLSGWMADFGEYLPQDAVVYGNVPSLEAHNLFPGLWAKINHEVLEETNKLDKIFFFMRAGDSLSPKYAQSIWAGDQNVDWSEDDGLPSVITAALSCAYSGMGLHFSDVGGYTSLHYLKRTKELLLRWCELSCFSPVMKSHEGNRPSTNHQFDTDVQTLEAVGYWSNVHYALKPYIINCETQNQNEGLSVIRPINWHYQEPWANECKNEYLLGRDVLVGPILEEGATTREVTLPNDEWIHLFTKKEYKGGTYTIESKLEDFCPPVFYRKESEFASLFQSIT